jgi:hypothetical protein
MAINWLGMRDAKALESKAGLTGSSVDNTKADSTDCMD